MTRTITHDTHTGPGLLHLRLPVGRIILTAAEGHRRTTVRLTPQHTDDPTAAEAIRRAQVAQSGGHLTITVPSTGSTGTTQTTVGRTGGRVVVSQNARVVTGTMIGVTIIDGAIIIGNGGNVVVASGGGIDAEVTVPAGQRVELDTDSADVTTGGRLAVLQVETGSGDIQFAEADTAELTTGSGDVHAGQVGTLQARTGSGDITVRAATGPTRLRTGSGDVRVHLAADVPLRARTGSGDIIATAAPGIRLNRSGLRTGSGRISAG